MIVFAAIDLLAGEVVQLVGGEPARARVRLPDPVETALQWQRAGFEALHIIDLDAARGTGSNREIIREVIAALEVPVQLGGGIRDEVAVERALELGVAHVITGTRAIADRPWIQRVSSSFPKRIVAAADVRDGVVLSHGWTQSTDQGLNDVLDSLNDCELGAVLITDVGREGQMLGADLELFGAAVGRSAHSVFAAGGIGETKDVVELQRTGAAGAVLGMALYTGAIDPLELRQALT